MSGIFGGWNLDGNSLPTDQVQRCVDRISPTAIGQIRIHDFGAASIAAKVTTGGDGSAARSSAQPIGQVGCVFDGRLDNRGDLIAALRRSSPVHDESAEVELVQAAYVEYRDRFVDHLEGDFSCAVFDRASNQLLIARDRLGVRPVCFTRVNRTFLFASEAKALLAWPGVAAIPDELMMADFALQFLAIDSQKRTFFRDVQSVPPGHVLVVTPETATLRRYFDFETERVIRFRTFTDYVDAFHQLVVASVRKRLRSARPVAISVSGGLDSAYIFAVASRLEREGTAPCPSVRGFNYAGSSGTPSCEEEYVCAIERAAGATIARIPQRAGFMQFAAREVWHTESPLVEGLACQRQAMLRAVSAEGAGRLLTGHWGDQVLSDSDYLIDLCRSRSWQTVRHHSRAWRISRRSLAARFACDVASRHLPRIFMRAGRRILRERNGIWRAPWYSARFRHMLRDRFEQARLLRPAGTSHAWAIYQQSRRSYHVQCLEWNCRIGTMHGIDMAFPYLDAELLQFLMSIPGDIQSYDGVARGLMRAAMRGLVPDAVIDRRTKGEFTHLANRSIEIDFPEIARILGPSAMLMQNGYLDSAGWRPMLDRWRSAIRTADNASLTNRLLELCGMELFLRQYTGVGDTSTSAAELQVTAS
jgi:asparagine synthase (glutamine-hydrolysing)